MNSGDIAIANLTEIHKKEKCESDVCSIIITVKDLPNVKGDWQCRAKVHQGKDVRDLADIVLNGEFGQFDASVIQAFTLPSIINYVVREIVTEVHFTNGPVLCVRYYPPHIVIPDEFHEHAFKAVIDEIEHCLQIIRTTLINTASVSQCFAKSRLNSDYFTERGNLQDSGDANMNHIPVSIRSIVLTADKSEFSPDLQYLNIHQGELLVSHQENKEQKSRCLELEHRNGKLEQTVRSLEEQLSKMTSRCLQLAEKRTDNMSMVPKLVEQMQHAALRCSRLEEVNGERELTILFLRGELATSTAHCGELEKTIGEHELTILQLREGLQSSASRLIELDNLLKERQNDIRNDENGSLSKQLKECQDELDEKTSQIEDMRVEVEGIKCKSLMDNENNSSNLQEAVEEYKRSCTNLRNDLLIAREENLRLSKQLAESGAALSQKASELESCRCSLDAANEKIYELGCLDESLGKSYAEVCERLSILSVVEMNFELTQQQLSENEKKLSETEQKLFHANTLLQAQVPQEELSAAFARNKDLEWNIQCLKRSLQELVPREDLSVAVARCEELEWEIQSLKRSLDETVDSITRLSDIEDKYVACCRELEKTQMLLESANREVNTAHIELEKSVGKERLMKQLSLQVEKKEEQVGVYADQLQYCKTELEAAYTEIEELKHQRSEALSRCRELEWDIQCLKSTLDDTVESMTRLSEIEDKYVACCRELDSTRKQLEQAEVEGNVLRERLNDEFNLELQSREEELALKSSLLNDCKVDLEAAYARIEALKEAAVRNVHVHGAHHEARQMGRGNGLHQSFRSMEYAYQKKIDELNATIVNQKRLGFDLHNNTERQRQPDYGEEVRRLQEECSRTQKVLFEKDLMIASLRRRLS